MAKSKKVFDPEGREHVLSARVTQELYDAVGDFADRMEAPTLSDAVREAIVMGLANSKDLEESFVKQAGDNARRNALRRMQGVMRAAMDAAAETFGSEVDVFVEEEYDED